MLIYFIQLNVSKILPVQQVIDRKIIEIIVLNICECVLRLRDLDCQCRSQGDRGDVSCPDPPPHVAMGSTELSRKVYTGTWAAVITRHSPCSWYESMRVLKKGFFSPNLRKSPSRLRAGKGALIDIWAQRAASLSRFHVLRSGSQFREKGLSPCVTMLAPS